MRGDRPPPLLLLTRATAFTPHARGSTLCRGNSAAAEAVYPACAGIDRKMEEKLREIFSLPRMRGDRPVTVTITEG